MKLGTKLIIAVVVAIMISMAISVVVQKSVIKNQGVGLIKGNYSATPPPSLSTLG